MADPKAEALSEFRSTLQAIKDEATETEKRGLDLAIFALDGGGLSDMNAAPTDSGAIPQPVSEEYEYIDEEPAPEPVRKGVAGSAAGAITLLAAWILSEVGVQMPLEVQAAAAVLVGAVIAYAQPEY